MDLDSSFSGFCIEDDIEDLKKKIGVFIDKHGYLNVLRAITEIAEADNEKIRIFRSCVEASTLYFGVFVDALHYLLMIAKKL